MEQSKLLELLSSMSLEEKIAQLLQLTGNFFSTELNELVTGPMQEMGIDQTILYNTGSILNTLGAENLIKLQDQYLSKNRHKIPMLFMADVIYGFRTVFPIPLGLGCTWNPELAELSAKVAAKEAAVSGLHITFSPMVDLVRDPRWGRVMETTGEDSYLNSEFARALVRGFQGDLLNPQETLGACVKHFAGYGGAEGGRDYNTFEVSERTLREQYLPAYKAAIDEGCTMVMTSFNTVDSIPATGNKWLMRDLLRNEWGFKGVVISDHSAVSELIAHGYAQDGKEAAEKAIKAGVDIEMCTPHYIKNLKTLVEEKAVDVALVDEAVLRILELKNKLDLFENPYRGASAEKEKEVMLCEAHLKATREIASKSLVLLKNDNNVLPLSKKIKKVAIVGPYADEKAALGFWAVFGDRNATVTVKEGIVNKIGENQVVAYKGCEAVEDLGPILLELGRLMGIDNSKPTSDTSVEIAKSVKAAQDADVIILALGEHMAQSGEGSSRTKITLSETQLKLVDEIAALKKPTVALLFNGRPLEVKPILDKVDALLEVWYPGTEGGNAIADVLFGDVNPSGRLSMSFPHSVGQIPVHYNHFNTGRPIIDPNNVSRFHSHYSDAPNTALYPFGYGLSYTSFEYTDFQLNKASMTAKDEIEASVMITNTGSYVGEETVQFYLRDITGSVVRPVKELKGFEKVVLNPGESKKVTFKISEPILRFYTADMKYESEAGRFKVLVGRNSSDVIEAEFIYYETQN